MLDQLVESKNNAGENTRRSGFVLTTLGVLAAVLVSGWTYSLFAKNFAMSGDFEMAKLVAPVTAIEEPQPAPKPDFKPEKTQNNPSDKIILRDMFDSIDSGKVPPKNTLGEKDVVSAKPYDLDKVKLGEFNQIPDGPVGRKTDDGNSQNCGLCDTNSADKNKPQEEKTPELVVKPSPKPEVKQPTKISGGVMNGKATMLAKPPYPPAAKLIRAEGAVQVQVLIDEAGNVVSASAVSGHPLLRNVSEAAARQSKFTPTKLSGQPVKVTGVIIYQFKP